MALAKLETGTLIDWLTPADAEKHITNPLLRELARNRPKAPGIYRQPFQFTTDAAGNLSGGAFSSGNLASTEEASIKPESTAYIVAVNRISMTTPLSTPAVPVTAGWIMLMVGGLGPSSLFDFSPPSGQYVLPCLFEYGEKQAAYLRGGERMYVIGGGLPALTVISGTVQYFEAQLPDEQAGTPVRNFGT